VTIEGTNLGSGLTVAQAAMTDNYATQCGFCTPGFVVSLTGFALSELEKNYSNALYAIGGNICRCTGYKSIKKAAIDFCEKMGDSDPAVSLERLIKLGFIPEYFENIAERLVTLDAMPLQRSETLFVSGGTDLYVQKADDLIDSHVHLIADNNDLKGIALNKGTWTVGAGNTVSDLWHHPEMNTQFPKLKKYLKLVSSEPIRNMASIGGNLVNASPIGDMTIFFMALNSDITIIDAEGKERILALNTFYKDYKTFDLQPGELIKSLDFKSPSPNARFNFEKVSKRTHLDIASVNSAALLTLDEDIIEDAHIAIGGVSPIPKYAFNTSAFLKGRPLDVSTVMEAHTILQDEISPISDVRGSSDYKRLLGRQLFLAHFIELFPEHFELNNFLEHA
jgi:xanthine dehydrogenase small subunit